MSERKYRQRGYQDEPREQRPKPARQPPEPGAPAGARRLSQDGPRPLNMPGFRNVVRCAQCGHVVGADIGHDTRCARCGSDLRTCSQCLSFDPGSTFECAQRIPARFSPKNSRNSCALFEPRTTVERETTTPKVDTARSAFDDLFNF